MGIPIYRIEYWARDNRYHVVDENKQNVYDFETYREAWDSLRGLTKDGVCLPGGQPHQSNRFYGLPIEQDPDAAWLIHQLDRLLEERDRINAKDELSLQDIRQRNSLNGRISRTRRKIREMAASQSESDHDIQPGPGFDNGLGDADGPSLTDIRQELATANTLNMSQHEVNENIVLNTIALGLIERTKMDKQIKNYIIGMLGNDREFLLDAFFDRS